LACANGSPPPRPSNCTDTHHLYSSSSSFVVVFRPLCVLSFSSL
jgi:hypothetical protein